MSKIWYGLAESLAYPNGEAGGNFLVMVSYLPLLRVGGGGGGGGATVGQKKQVAIIWLCKIKKKKGNKNW